MEIGFIKEKVAKKVAPVLLVGGLALGGCSEDGPKPVADTIVTPITDEAAACKALHAVVTDRSKNEVTLDTSFTLANGVQYESTTYIFDPEEASVTVSSEQDASGKVVHQYPLKDGTHKHQIEAVINYTVPPSDTVYGASDTCTVNVVFVNP